MNSILFRIAALICLLQTFAASSATLIATLTSPFPADGELFGRSMAAVGTDRVLIGAYSSNVGAPEAGAAYLFSTDGTLLTAFTNPAPANVDYFGYSVAEVGSDQVLISAYSDDIGASDAGAAFLFSTNGSLLTTFTNPTPAAGDHFGNAVAAVGSDKVIIAAYLKRYAGVPPAGAAYLFSTNGDLLTTFTNPTPEFGEYFGFSVAAVGSDRVIVGANRDNTGAFSAGAAYLFSTNGTLLTTFTNPTPGSYEEFGCSLAAVGPDKVLIGAHQDNTGAPWAGVAYLFSTNGTRLTTFTNPNPAFGDDFGISVAAVGSDQVLIGAGFDSTGNTTAGAAYLFHTNGALLTTFTNPTPANNNLFGYSVAPLGSDKIVISAYRDDTVATNAGMVYVFTLQPAITPTLSIRLTVTNTILISWPSSSTGFTPQQNTNAIATVNWSNVSEVVQDDGMSRSFIINPPTGNRFYRLFKP